MTVRTTGASPALPRRSTEPLGPPPPPDPVPIRRGEDASVDPSPATGAPTGGGVEDGAARPPEAALSSSPRETRREVREARHRRRLLLAACAAVVAACLALTILVVSMARQRPSGLPAPLSAGGAAATARSVPPFSTTAPFPYPGAAAPSGGHH